MSARLQALWYRAAPPPLALRVLSRAFGLGARARRAAYALGWLPSQRLERPVVVVGNLSVGGSGKTPLVIWVVTQLRAAGFVPGIVLRGYGGSASRGHEIVRVRADSDPALVGDEALLSHRRTGAPVAVGRNRVRAARLLLAGGVDVIVSDDGLQHLALARNFEIAVIDGERGFGNGYLLPAGPLREPRARIDSVDAVVINGEGRYWR
ncbi:MAG TPA: tetraacyldisaccharide 4'-kinase, partial [Steroidobacteraceae bacterium]|nr:tetraacyldisaccharide 4'-kinase [Steroidobacteraceae bacterium]